MVFWVLLWTRRRMKEERGLGVLHQRGLTDSQQGEDAFLPGSVEKLIFLRLSL